MKPLFEHFGYPMPAVYPRARCTLTTLKLNKLRQKLGLALEDLLSPENDLLERVLKNVARHPAQEAVRRRREEADRAVAQLEADLESLVPKDRALRGQAKILHDQMVAGFDRLERTMLHGDRKQTEAVAVQVRRLCAALMPGKKPQERVYCAFSFLFEHGPELIPRLLRSLDVESFTMNEFVL